MISYPKSTSLLVEFRAFLASDHVTPATGKTIAITISKNGGAFGNPNAGALNATEISSGWYKASLDTTDTGTAGPLAVRGAEAAIDDVGVEYMVQDPPAVNVTQFNGASATSASGIPEVKVASIAAAAITAASIASAALSAAKFAADTGLVPIFSGTASAGGASTITLAGGSAVDNAYKGSMVLIVGGTGVNQSAHFISAYDGTTKVATVKNAYTTNPDNTSVFVVLAQAPVDVFSISATAQTQADVGALAAAIKAVTDLLPNAGALTSIATAAALATTDGKVDAINAKTTNLPAAPASTTNITAGTITTVTNLTNAPTVGDLTATMKASVTTAASNRVQKNTALAGFQFFMRDATTHVAATGLTVTAKRSLDGAALASCANSASEISNGLYTIDLAAADLNGNNVVLRFTATGADDCIIKLATQPT